MFVPSLLLTLLYLAIMIDARPAVSSSIVRAPYRSRRPSTAAASLQTPISAVKQSSTGVSPAALKASSVSKASNASEASTSSKTSKSKVSGASLNSTLSPARPRPPKVTAPYKNIFKFPHRHRSSISHQIPSRPGIPQSNSRARGRTMG